MRVAATTLAAAIFAGVSWPVLAQDPPPIWAGVYTAGQAERGRLVVQHHCSECHGEDLSGGEGPALMGATFMVKWETHSVERLFNKIRDTMPSLDSTDVTEREKLDSVAFILQQNGFPAGSSELADTAGVLGSLRLLPKGGPAPPRAGALVQAIGCLAETGAGRWALTQSTEPQVTTLEPLAAADKQSMADTGAGTATIQLLSVFPSPAALKGHRAIAKGLLIKTESDVRINVMSLESIAPECGK